MRIDQLDEAMRRHEEHYKCSTGVFLTQCNSPAMVNLKQSAYAQTYSTWSPRSSWYWKQSMLFDNGLLGGDQVTNSAPSLSEAERLLGGASTSAAGTK